MSKIVFAVEMSELKKKINFVRTGLGSSKTDLAVMLIRFEISGTKAVLFAASKEMFTRCEMKISRPEGDNKDGYFSVMGSKIERLITQVEVETLSFTADEENVEVTAGFLTVNFELFDGAVLKTVETGVLEHLTMEGLTTSKSALEEGLVCAKSCITSNSIRPDVTHAELRTGRMLSSDGRKIMIFTHDGFPEGMTLKVPASSLTPVVSAVKNIEAENLQVIVGSSYYYIKGNRNEFTLGVRKVERSFPQVEGRITASADPTDEVSIDKHVLEAMLRGVALGLATEDVKVGIEIGGVKTESYVEVSAYNHAGRRSHERASAGRQKEEKINFPISFKHLLDTIAVFKGDSVVDMMVMTKLNLLMIRDTTDTREVLTIVPFRTDSQIADEKKEAEAATAAKAAANKSEEDETAAAGATTSAALDNNADVDLADA